MGVKHSQLTLWLSGARARAGAREGRLRGRGGLASLSNARGAVPLPPPPHCPPEPAVTIPFHKLERLQWTEFAMF